MRYQDAFRLAAEAAASYGLAIDVLYNPLSEDAEPRDRWEYVRSGHAPRLFPGADVLVTIQPNGDAAIR